MRKVLVRTPMLTTVLLGLLGGQAIGQGMTPHMVARLQAVTSAEISPDGRFVAYIKAVPRIPGKDEDGSAWSELHLLDLASGESRPFVTGKVSVGSLAWAPDSSVIYFLTKRNDDEHRTLYQIAVDGGEARAAAGLDTDISGFHLSLDGSRVALIAAEPEADREDELKKQGFAARIYEEDWKPRRLHISHFGQDSDVRVIETNGVVYSAKWSPTDQRIAVSLAPTPLSDDSYMYQRIRILDSVSGDELIKIENPGKLGQFEWSPDGKRLAFISGADINDPAAGRLMVADTSTGSWRDLLPNHQGHVEGIAWRDAESIIVLDSHGVWTRCLVVGVSDGSRRDWGPDQGPVAGSLSLDRAGTTAALVASTPAHPDEVFTLRQGAEALERRTNSNEWLNQVELASQEIVRYRARDGLELEGILMRPLGEQKGRRYPLILVVHGGPEAHESNGWLTTYSRLGQAAAARGMAVFFPNYRGSTGRGVGFAKSSQADPAGKEFDDVVDAVDHFIETGLADREKVGITGGSYGGYATAWCSTFYSYRFAAGVMFVGISDKISKVGTTDIPQEEFLVHARKRPWDDWDFFLQRSPVYHADRGRTPLLILHGTDDPRVNVGQSRELYRHLKLRGQAPVRLVLYPGEEHGNRKAAARLDYSLRALRWFEHYLKGVGGDPPDHPVEYDLEEFEAEKPGS